jgi:hypothetical protein
MSGTLAPLRLGMKGFLGSFKNEIVMRKDHTNERHVESLDTSRKKFGSDCWKIWKSIYDETQVNAT